MELRPASFLLPILLALFLFLPEGLLTLRLVIHLGSPRNVFFVFLFRHVPHLPAQDGPDASHYFRSIVRDK